jgi:hypothetical protein
VRSFRAVIIALSVCWQARASAVKLIHDNDLYLIIKGRTIGFIKIPAVEEVEVLSIIGTKALIKRGDDNFTINSASLH